VSTAFGASAAFILVLHMSSATADEPLTAAQQVQVRRAVYDNGPKFSVHNDGGGLGKRILVVPQELRECHRSNTVETLRLLADVVRGGGPKDAVLAAAYAEALAGNPVAAALAAGFPVEYVDRSGDDAPRSGRPNLLKRVEEHLGAAEKRAKENTDKHGAGSKKMP
jgi:hypothetical protein